MCPRNCGPANRQWRRVSSPWSCHKPLRVAISSVTRRAVVAIFFATLLPLQLHRGTAEVTLLRARRQVPLAKTLACLGGDGTGLRYNRGSIGLSVAGPARALFVPSVHPRRFHYD